MAQNVDVNPKFCENFKTLSERQKIFSSENLSLKLGQANFHFVPDLWEAHNEKYFYAIYGFILCHGVSRVEFRPLLNKSAKRDGYK